MSISNSVLIFSLVLRIPCFCLFVWPFYVAGAASGRYFWTACAVKPFHVENCLLLMDFSRVCFGGLNAAWSRYLISAAFYVMEYVLHAMCLVFLVFVFGVVVLQSCNGNIHDLVCGSLPPFHMSLLL